MCRDETKGWILISMRKDETKGWILISMCRDETKGWILISRWRNETKVCGWNKEYNCRSRTGCYVYMHSVRYTCKFFYWNINFFLKIN